jgi:hypothetical protein
MAFQPFTNKRRYLAPVGFLRQIVTQFVAVLLPAFLELSPGVPARRR